MILFTGIFESADSTAQELRVHFEPVLWKKYDNTVNEHAMCSVIGAAVQMFKNIKSKTLIMPAR